MKHYLSILLIMASVIASHGVNKTSIVDEYDLKMHLRVPRVYSNTDSLGLRKYVCQTIRGTLRVEYGEGEPTLVIVGLENRSHKVNGRYVTYSVDIGKVIWHVIGDNASGKFTRASVSMSFTANPSYNIGDDEPDNTLVVTCSGAGTAKQIGPISSVYGKVAGQIGCGCRAYSHISPTRISGPSGNTDDVVDIASTYGTFKIKLRGRTYK